METAKAINISPALSVETWLELRCPACVDLGWHSPRLLFRVMGEVEPQLARLEMRCWMCHSTIAWTIGTPEIVIVAQGRRNHKRQTAAFE